MTPTAPSSTDPSGAPEARPRCPRCGYALDGVVATWTDACPLDGRCSECGLEFGWVEALRPGRVVPRWCVEFAPTRRVPIAVIATTLGSLVVPRFWCRIRMAMPIVRPRLAAHVLGMLVLAYLAVAGFQARAAYRAANMSPTTVRAKAAAVAFVCPWDDGAIATLVGASTKASASGLLLDKFATVRRLTGTSGFTVPLYPCVHPDRPDLWWLDAAVLFAVATLITPACFLLLPHSLRRAEVRRMHLVRAGVYALPIVLAAFIAVLEVIDGNSWGSPRAGPSQARLVLALPPWLAWWWVCVARDHLRLPHAAAVGIALVVLALLLAATLLVVPVLVLMLVAA